MRDTMAGQPARCCASCSPTPGRSRRRRSACAGAACWLCGTGTSWHAANHGAWLLRAAGVDASPVQAADAALDGPAPAAGDGLLLLSHTGAKRHAKTVLERARAGGVECVVLGAPGRDGVDLDDRRSARAPRPTPPAISARWPAWPQLATALGAELGRPRARSPTPSPRRSTARARASRRRTRLLEFTGVGPNQWTAAEGALKVRETARVATEGLAAEQLLHGPLGRARRARRARVLDGGGPAAERLDDVARLAEHGRRRVHRVSAPSSASPCRSSRSPSPSSGSRSSAPRRWAPIPTPSATTSPGARTPGKPSNSISRPPRSNTQPEK